MRIKITNLLSVLLGTFCLMLPSFYNGYPIVFSDTGTYIGSGFELYNPADRPITYGIFIRLASLNGLTAWSVVFFQSLLFSYLLFQFYKIVFGEQSYIKWGILTTVLLTLFSGIAWASSMLIADVFTPIALLSLIVILWGNPEKRKKILLYIVFFISVAMHLSHLLIFFLLPLLILAFSKWLFTNQLYKKKRALLVTFAILAAGTAILIAPTLKKATCVMSMAVMVEQGIAKPYLDEYCATKHYKLCPCKDSLNMNACDFVWSPSSPFYKLGWWMDTVMPGEFKDITWGTYTKPKYIWMHIKASFKYSLIQLQSFLTARGNSALLEGSPVYPRIEQYFNRELHAYVSSKQNKNQDEMDSQIMIWNSILTPVIYTALIVIAGIFVFFRKKVFNDGFGSISVTLLLCILLNAWDCGTFSQVNERYESRIIWLIPLIAIIALIKLYDNYIKERKYKEAVI